MSYYRRRTRRALERLLAAENDRALGTTRRRLMMLAGAACGLACDFVMKACFTGYCKVIEFICDDSVTHPAIVQLAVLILAGILGLSYYFKWLRFRCCEEYMEYEEDEKLRRDDGDDKDIDSLDEIFDPLDEFEFDDDLELDALMNLLSVQDDLPFD